MMISFLSSVFQRGLFFIGAYNALAPLVNGQNEVAWILTGLSSFALSFIGLALIPEMFSNFGVGFASYVLSTSASAEAACDFFIAFCISDLLVGYFHYRSKISRVEGWLHHCFYIILLTTFRIYNIPKAFWIFTWCEIPTCLKSMSQFFPLYRTAFKDAFSYTFVVFRILLFTIVLIEFFKDCPTDLLLLTGVPAFAVWSAHVKWGVNL